MKKKKGFFDEIDEPETVETERAADAEKNVSQGEISASEVIENGDDADEDGGVSESLMGGENAACTCKKRNAVVFSAIAVVLCAFVFTGVAYSLGLFKDKYSETPDSGSGGGYVEEFYYWDPDYDTDIFTLEEYLRLDRAVKYAPDSSQSYLIQNGDYAAEGEPGLIVIGEYLNAAIAGDNEKINALFTEEFLKEHKGHERFPQQKLFKIKIRNERVIEEKDGYTVYYFTVSYRIFRNDGLFRKGVDEDRELAQIFEVFVYNDGSGRINLIKDRPGYVLDI